METDYTHLIIDMEKCNVRLDKKAVVEDFLKKLNKEILHMYLLSGPHIEYIYRVDQPEKNGVTGFMIFEESHASIHTFSNFSELSFDAYSCKSFHSDIPRVVEMLKSTFSGEITNLHVLTR